MAINRQKISQMTPKGSALGSTDLIEVSVNTGSGYVTKSVTGQDVIDAGGGVFVPYTGATQDVDLGENGLDSGFVTFDTTPTSTPSTQGTLSWDVDDETLQLVMNGSIMKIGEDQYYPVKNQTGTTIAKGTTVRFAGTLGSSGRLLIAPYIADGSVSSSTFMGVTSEEILNGEDGKVMWFGRIRGINTNAFNEGDILYASPTVAGAFTTVSNNQVQVAAVINKSTTNGVIFVRPSIYPSVTALLGYTPLENVVDDTTPQLGGNLDVNGYKITSDSDQDVIINPNGIGITKIESDLHLRDTAGLTALQVNFYEGFTNGSNYVGIKAANSLSANTTYTLPTADGTSGQVLSTNGTGSLSWATAGGGLTVGTTVITSGTVGRILFEGTGNVLQQDSTLFWDNTNKRLGVGATPNTAVRLDVRAQGALSTDIAFRVRNSADSADIFSVRGNNNIYLAEGTFNGSNTIFHGSTSLLQYSHNANSSIALGQGAAFTNATNYNTIVGASSTTGATVGFGIALGYSVLVTATGAIGIGDRARAGGINSIRIGNSDGGASAYTGTNSIHLGKTISGNSITADDVLMTYFNSQSSSTLTRANGSFGLLGQQSYIIGNGGGTYGIETFMGNGGNTLVVTNHPSVPSTNILNTFQLYSNDITAGNAAPHFRTENGSIVKLYQETTGVAAATLVSNAGTALTSTDTFGGYTLQQIAQALKNLGILA
jgi:hypothetical protein